MAERMGPSPAEMGLGTKEMSAEATNEARDAKISDLARKAEESNLPQLASFLYGRGKVEDNKDYVNSTKSPQELAELAAGIVLLAGVHDVFAEAEKKFGELAHGDKHVDTSKFFKSTKPEVQRVLDHFEVERLRKDEFSIRAKRAGLKGSEKMMIQALARVAGIPVSVGEEYSLKGTWTNPPDYSVHYNEDGITFESRFFKPRSK